MYVPSLHITCAQIPHAVCILQRAVPPCFILQSTNELPQPLPRAQPEQFIHIFVKNMGWLLDFLESITRIHTDSSPLVWDTLLELYLRDDVGAIGDDAKLAPEKLAKQRREKALELLQTPDVCWQGLSPP
jgi:hypothetical protein